MSAFMYIYIYIYMVESLCAAQGMPEDQAEALVMNPPTPRTRL